MRRFDGSMNSFNHALILLRAGYCENLGEAFTDDLRLSPHAACNNYSPIFCNSSLDSFKGFRFSTIEKAACINDNNIGSSMIAG